MIKYPFKEGSLMMAHCKYYRLHDYAQRCTCELRGAYPRNIINREGLDCFKCKKGAPKDPVAYLQAVKQMDI